MVNNTYAKIKNFFRYPLYQTTFHPAGAPPQIVYQMLSSRTIYNPFGSCHWMISLNGIGGTIKPETILFQDGNAGIQINQFNNIIVNLSRFGSSWSDVAPAKYMQYFMDNDEIITNNVMALNGSGSVVGQKTCLLTVDIFTVNLFFAGSVVPALVNPYIIITGG